MIIKRKLYSKISGLPKAVRNISYKVGGKTPKAARKAVKLGRDVKKAELYLKTTPEHKMVGDFGKFTSAHPIQASATIGTFPMSGAAVEGVLQKFKPYKKATNWTGAQYEKHLRKPVEGITRAVINMPW